MLSCWLVQYSEKRQQEWICASIVGCTCLCTEHWGKGKQNQYQDHWQIADKELAISINFPCLETMLSERDGKDTKIWSTDVGIEGEKSWLPNEATGNSCA